MFANFIYLINFRIPQQFLLNFRYFNLLKEELQYLFFILIHHHYFKTKNKLIFFLISK